MLKLYSSPISPFAARVKIALHKKGLPWEDLGLPDPPAADHGLKSPAFLAINPVGKIPVLVLEDGAVIIESETILDYLDDAYPEPPLRPADPLARARMRTVIRIAETYAATPMFRLFPQLNPATRDEAVTADEVRRMREGLGLVERFVDGGRYANGEALSLADCILVPTLHLARTLGRLLALGDILAETPKLAAYFERAQAEPAVAQAVEELDQAMAAAAA